MKPEHRTGSGVLVTSHRDETPEEDTLQRKVSFQLMVSEISIHGPLAPRFWAMGSQNVMGVACGGMGPFISWQAGR